MFASEVSDSLFSDESDVSVSIAAFSSLFSDSFSSVEMPKIFYNSTESFYTKTINIPIFSGYDLNMFSDIENKYLKIYHDDFKLIFRKSGTEKLLRLTISIGDKNVLENVIEECLNKIKIAI